MSQENFKNSIDGAPLPEVETEPFDEQGLVNGVSNLLDSLESDLPALALKGVEDSRMSWPDLRKLLNKIPNVSRDEIGRYSDYITGKKRMGLSERSLSTALDEQIEKLISGGSDLEKTRDRLVALKTPDYVISSMAKAAMRASPNLSGRIAAVFNIKD